MKKLYVGNLPYTAGNDDLSNLFSQVGQVVSASVIMDKFSGRSKGFGFVEMTNDNEADEAIKKFDGYELEGRKLVVNEARPQEKENLVEEAIETLEIADLEEIITSLEVAEEEGSTNDFKLHTVRKS